MMNDKKSDIKTKLGIECFVSAEMKSALRIWKKAYMNKSIWLNNDIKSLRIPSTVANEISRLVTIENEIKIEGSSRADFISSTLKYFRENKKYIIELACATGGIYFKPYVNGNQIIVDFVYQDEAIPFQYDGNLEMTGVIFPTFLFKKGKRYTRLEIHNYSKEKYTIENRCFVCKEKNITDIFNFSLGNEISLDSVDEWKNIEQIVEVDGNERPFFSYMRIPIANDIEIKSPLGVSVYARAIEDIEKADKQFARLDWEFESKETAIEMDESYFKEDIYGNNIIPAGKERLYRLYAGESISGEGKLFKHFSPEIRDQSFINGLNKYLQQIEFKCGLAYGTISDPQIVDKTAEEIKASKQRSYQLVCDIQGSLEDALKNLIVTIDEMCSAYQLVAEGNINVSFKWDDSIVVDSEKEKQQDIQDVNLGVMSKWEYRMKWFGEDEQTAKRAINEIEKNKPGITSFYGDE